MMGGGVEPRKSSGFGKWVVSFSLFGYAGPSQGQMNPAREVLSVMYVLALLVAVTRIERVTRGL